jgi:hypothetical protein
MWFHSTFEDSYIVLVYLCSAVSISPVKRTELYTVFCCAFQIMSSRNKGIAPPPPPVKKRAAPELEKVPTSLLLSFDNLIRQNRVSTKNKIPYYIVLN